MGKAGDNSDVESVFKTLKENMRTLKTIEECVQELSAKDDGASPYEILSHPRHTEVDPGIPGVKTRVLFVE